MNLVKPFASGAAVVAALLAGPASGATLLRGVLGIHDPSTVTLCAGRYYVFGTGQNIISRSSADKEYWVAGPSVFTNPPAWTTNAVPGFTGFFWAPDVLYLNGHYYLYYAVSTFGSQVSAIGLATSPTLDPTDPSYHWTDQGPVLQSANGSLYNTIDPCPIQDPAGNVWMSFGSYWLGIYLVQLDPSTGKRITPTSPVYQLANNTSIEASYLFHHGDYYYLFVNWGTCCSGINSTYNLRVGRSASITGPYRDRNGLLMTGAGGTLFLEGTGKYVGPGHTGILTEGGTNWLSYHYYDANNNGAPNLDFEPLSWTPDGWPAFTNDWSAVYAFAADARDENGQYYGLLQGATVQVDAVQGHVLNFSGAGQFAQLPAGVGFARTFAARVRWRGGAPGQRVFDFGQGTNAYLFLTPSALNGNMRFAITTSASGGEQALETASSPVGSWTHVAVTLDGRQGILYVNGAPVSTNTSLTLSPLNVVPTANYLGRSQSPTNPYFNGQLAGFWAFGRALSAAEIAGLATNPPSASTPGSSPTNHWLAVYNFEGDAGDANGQFNGALVNGASIPTVPVRGPVLNLNGGTQYVSLPSGVGNFRMFAGWVKWNGGKAWQRIFDFGVDTARYAFLTPSANSGRLRFAISTAGGADERTIEAPAQLPVGVWTHVAVALDGRQGVLFLNGQAVAVNHSVNLLPSDILGSANYLGRSHFADPYFNGQMDSLQISSHTLPIETLLATPISLQRQPTNLVLSWPALAGGPILHSATNLPAWSVVTNVPLTTNGFQVLTLPDTAGAGFFRLRWPASTN